MVLVEAVSISLGRRQSGVEAKIIIHRVMDGSHFPVQVTAGALIGVASSVLLVASPRVADGGSLGGGGRVGEFVTTVGRLLVRAPLSRK